MCPSPPPSLRSVQPFGEAEHGSREGVVVREVRCRHLLAVAEHRRTRVEEAVQATFLVHDVLIEDLALDRVSDGRERLPDLPQPAVGHARRLQHPHRLNEAVQVFWGAVDHRHGLANDLLPGVPLRVAARRDVLERHIGEELAGDGAVVADPTLGREGAAIPPRLVVAGLRDQAQTDVVAAPYGLGIASKVDFAVVWSTVD